MLGKLVGDQTKTTKYNCDRRNIEERWTGPHVC